MRIRRKTWARPELAACPYYIPQPEAQKGHWQEVFSSPRPIHLDLGCGKCVFLAQAAHTHREVNFIGIDITLLNQFPVQENLSILVTYHPISLAVKSHQINIQQ